MLQFRKKSIADISLFNLSFSYYPPKPWNADKRINNENMKTPITIHVTNTYEKSLWSNLRCIKKATTKANFIIENPSIAGTRIYLNPSWSNHHTSTRVIIPSIAAITQ